MKLWFSNCKFQSILGLTFRLLNHNLKPSKYIFLFEKWNFWKFAKNMVVVCSLHSINPILTQNNFAFYWKHLAEWLKNNSNFKLENVVAILYSCSSHRTKTTVDYLKRSNWSIYFLTPYTYYWLLWNLSSTTSNLIWNLKTERHC